MDGWKATPLGVAVVDQTPSGAFGVHHVCVSADGVRLSGMWLLDNPEPGMVRDLLTHFIVTGTRDGLDAARGLTGDALSTVDLAALVEACEEAEAQLQAAWQEHQDAEPRKRANLKPLDAKAWPQVADDGDAADLTAAGTSPFPESTPTEARDLLAHTKLVAKVVGTWWELETERTSRSYLPSGDRQLFPAAWLAANPPYWPALAR